MRPPPLEPPPPAPLTPTATRGAARRALDAMRRLVPPSEPPHVDPDGRCDDCGAALHGPFCARCGQPAERFPQPFLAFVRGFAAEIIEYEGKVWRSLGVLLFRPGRLTNAFLAGHRTRYVRPLRLYIVASVGFFFLLSVLDPVGRINDVVAERNGAADSLVSPRVRLAEVDALLARDRAARVDRLPRAPGVPEAEAAMEELEDRLDEVGDTTWGAALARRRLRAERAILTVLPADTLVRRGDLDRAARALTPGDEGGVTVDVSLPERLQGSTLARLNRADTPAEQAAATADFARSAIGHVPTVMFAMLPVFALIMKALYARRRRYYAEHVVFALHTHAFAFFVFALIAALVGLGGGRSWTGTLAGWLALAIPVYFFAAQKAVYRQGWQKTAVKFFALAWTYAVVLSFGLVVAVVLAAVLD